MKIHIGVATFEAREKALELMMKSLDEQTVKADVVTVYDNSKMAVNLYDNGKFVGLLKSKEPVYYLTMDDDIYYPRTYIEDMVNAIDKHKCIVTHHGRKLRGVGIGYYQKHELHHFANEVAESKVIDVAGTGVTGFRTDYFYPESIIFEDRYKMTDLLFSHKACMEGKQIMLLSHHAGYLKQIDIDTSTSIYTSMQFNESELINYANEIWRRKNTK